MTIKEIFDHIDSLFVQNQANRVEPFLLSQLYQADTMADFEKIVVICNELGGIYRATGRCDDSIAVYEKALDGINRLGIRNTENHATTLINYGTTCAINGEIQKGLDLFKKAEEILCNLNLDWDYRMAALHNNMSMLYQDLSLYDDAILHLRHSLSILERLNDSQIEIATTYSNMAQIYLLQRNLKEASEACDFAIRQFEKISGDSDVHYSAAIETRSRIRLAQGDAAGAINDLKIAINLIERDYGKDTPLCKALKKNLKHLEADISSSPSAALYNANVEQKGKNNETS